jgi:putative tricarboxylic transport membrane protein
MLEAYGTAIATLLQPINLLVLVLAVFIGLIIGVIPGISGMVMLPVILPFIFRMPAELALILLIALHSVVHTSGSITAILLNIPGTGPNAATMLDGFPMNQRGEGARAIGAAVTSSMFGGTVPVFLALAMVPLILPIAIAFGQPEMAALVLLGISFLAALSGGSVTKGIIAGMLGLLLSFIGYHSITGIQRFSFGTAFLYDGIELIPLVLGLFGLSELFHLAMRGQATIAQKAVVTKLSNIFGGVKDVWRHKWLWFRSTLIGYIIGVIPGIGGEVATWVCYGQAKQTSKHPEKFGTGIVEGVIAPEAANNAKEAGALLTTMALGIPGSAIMAIFLAAFLMVGVTPGPSMMVVHLPLALTLLLGIALANIIGGVVCLLVAPYLARVASVHLDFLFPGILIIVLAGIYVATLSALNFIVALAFGLLGLAMKRYGYSRPALLLGFVLGGLFENYSLLSIKIYGPLFFIRPIPLVLFAIIILLLSYPHLMKVLPWFQGRLKKA